MELDYIVSEETKKLWAVELSLFEKLEEICKKWNLTYYAADGTLLGAARHKGFIPWDDDMDFWMLWPDYKKLMEVAPKECQFPFVFQGIYSDLYSMVVCSRLRRSDTTGFTKWEHENIGPEHDLGIFIDIFPLFYVPDSEEEREEQKEKVMHLWRCIHGHDALVLQKKGKIINEKYVDFIPDYLELCKEREIRDVDNLDITWLKEEYLEACAGKETKTDVVGLTATRCHDLHQMWDLEWFEHTVELPFENTTVNCAGEYEKVLEREYGDWRTPVMGSSEHEMFAVDTDTPWKRYLENLT